MLIVFMDTKKLFNHGFSSFCSFLWVSLWSFVLSFFSSIAKYLPRLKPDQDDSKGIDHNFDASHFLEDDQVLEKSCDYSNSDGFGEKVKDGLSSLENKYQFLSSRDVSGFIEGPHNMSFAVVEEIFMCSNEDLIKDEFMNTVDWDKKVGDDEDDLSCSSDTADRSCLSVDEEFEEHKAEMDRMIDSCEEHNEATDVSVSDIDDHIIYSWSSSDEGFEEHKATTIDASDTDDHIIFSWSSADEGCQEHTGAKDGSDHQETEDPVEILCFEGTMEEKTEEISAECEILEENEREICGNLLENQISSFELQPNYQADIIDINEFSSDESGDEILLPETSTKFDDSKPKRIGDGQEINLSNSSSFDSPEIVISIYKEENFAAEEFIELDPHFQKSDDSHDSQPSESEDKEEMQMVNNLQKMEEQNSEKSKQLDSDSEDEDGELDILQEHKHLVQQMKMEMRYSKMKGLPTISEECETPKTVDDLKPLKIDERFEYKDRMEEIHKFYKSYAEKMRKLDILNYQTLHAISFLQLKDSEVFMAAIQKSSSTSFIKPFIPKFWPYKLQRIGSDSTYKSISETHRDLELVYVGQICLSWEILNWQYKKAKELIEYDSQQRYHSYTKVASDYQQFQVLVERFVEDEPFQGPRIQNYVKNRCVVRSLLQVPMIKDDFSKEKKDRGEEEQDMISVAMLEKIIKHSMQVFWEFLRTEKGETKMVLKANEGTNIHVHDPAYLRLLSEIKTSLQQKERSVKEIQRSRNCIVKKLQKLQRGGGEHHHAMFISQVELKLISRVLNLSRVTIDQLMWCQRKLNNISFLGRKVHVEPSFSLFPC